MRASLSRLALSRLLGVRSAGTARVPWKAVAMQERKAPRLSDLKRALRWLRAQYQRRAEEAASTEDRMIERIRRARAKKAPH